MGGVVVERGDRMLLTVATVAAAVVAVSILTAVVVGELPDVLWFLLVPVGMLGGGVLAVLALAVFLVRRARPSRS